MKFKPVLLSTLAATMLAGCSYMPWYDEQTEQEKLNNQKAAEILQSVTTHVENGTVASKNIKTATTKAYNDLPQVGSKPISTRWDNQGLSGAVNNMPDDVFVLAPKHNEFDSGAEGLNNYLNSKAKNPKTFTKTGSKSIKKIKAKYKPNNHKASKNDYSIYGKKDIENVLKGDRK